MAAQPNEVGRVRIELATYEISTDFLAGHSSLRWRKALNEASALKQVQLLDDATKILSYRVKKVTDVSLD